ncbi:Growth/Differentiation Factor 3 [Manis pentadactyla]|nr:Growth/Differentiation Factor 3 [Manis pentadactyla]
MEALPGLPRGEGARRSDKRQLTRLMAIGAKQLDGPFTSHQAGSHAPPGTVLCHLMMAIQGLVTGAARVHPRVTVVRGTRVSLKSRGSFLMAQRQTLSPGCVNPDLCYGLPFQTSLKGNRKRGPLVQKPHFQVLWSRSHISRSSAICRPGLQTGGGGAGGLRGLGICAAWPGSQPPGVRVCVASAAAEFPVSVSLSVAVTFAQYCHDTAEGNTNIKKRKMINAGVSFDRRYQDFKAVRRTHQPRDLCPLSSAGERGERLRFHELSSFLPVLPTLSMPLPLSTKMPFIFKTLCAYSS